MFVLSYNSLPESHCNGNFDTRQVFNQSQNTKRWYFQCTVVLFCDWLKLEIFIIGFSLHWQTVFLSDCRAKVRTCAYWKSQLINLSNPYRTGTIKNSLNALLCRKSIRSWDSSSWIWKARKNRFQSKIIEQTHKTKVRLPLYKWGLWKTIQKL